MGIHYFWRLKLIHIQGNEDNQLLGVGCPLVVLNSLGDECEYCCSMGAQITRKSSSSLIRRDSLIRS